ncbi:hypothetical protein [Alienimonas chondri]|nr:hypothetical protein [Alienimonas chondri]
MQAAALLWADVPLVISVGCLVISYSIQRYARLDCAIGFNVGLGFFAFALCALIVMHVVQWVLTIKKIL